MSFHIEEKLQFGILLDPENTAVNKSAYLAHDEQKEKRGAYCGPSSLALFATLLCILHANDDSTTILPTKSPMSPPTNSQLVDTAAMSARQWMNDPAGIIPSQIGLLTQLEAIHLESKKLLGSIPSEVGLLTELMYLQLSDNNLNGFLPSQLGKLSKLKAIRLEDNHLIGFIPSQLGKLKGLNALYLDENDLTGYILSVGQINRTERTISRWEYPQGIYPFSVGQTDRTERTFSRWQST